MSFRSQGTTVQPLSYQSHGHGPGCKAWLSEPNTASVALDKEWNFSTGKKNLSSWVRWPKVRHPFPYSLPLTTNEAWVRKEAQWAFAEVQVREQSTPWDNSKARRQSKNKEPTAPSVGPVVTVIEERMGTVLPRRMWIWAWELHPTFSRQRKKKSLTSFCYCWFNFVVKGCSVLPENWDGRLR